MALKFRKNNYYKIIITFLICLILGFLYLGNYNLTESLANNDISNNIIANNDTTNTTNTTNTSNTTSTTSYDEMRNNNISDANKALAATGGNNGSVESNTQIQAFTLAQNLQDKNTF
jgi:hypothetical protein